MPTFEPTPAHIKCCDVPPRLVGEYILGAYFIIMLRDLPCSISSLSIPGKADLIRT